MSDDDLIERVRELIYDADPEIPAAAVVALCREAIATDIGYQARFEGVRAQRVIKMCANVARGEQQ